MIVSQARVTDNFLTDNFVTGFMVIALIVIVLIYLSKGKESAKDVFWVIAVVFALLFVISLFIAGVIGGARYIS